MGLKSFSRASGMRDPIRRDVDLKLQQSTHGRTLRRFKQSRFTRHGGGLYALKGKLVTSFGSGKAMIPDHRSSPVRCPALCEHRRHILNGDTCPHYVVVLETL